MLTLTLLKTSLKPFVSGQSAKVLEGLNPAQQIVKIVDEELTKTMGETAVPLNKAPKIPTIIMMVGLQGAIKTTTVGKLTNRLKTEEKGASTDDCGRCLSTGCDRSISDRW